MSGEVIKGEPVEKLIRTPFGWVLVPVKGGKGV